MPTERNNREKKGVLSRNVWDGSFCFFVWLDVMFGKRIQVGAFFSFSIRRSERRFSPQDKKFGLCKRLRDLYKNQKRDFVIL